MEYFLGDGPRTAHASRVSVHLHWVVATLGPWWPGVRAGLLLATGYCVWLRAFERSVEPRLRRMLGAVISERIVWVPGGGALGVWGVDEGAAVSSGLIAALGALALLVAAVAPCVVLGTLALRGIAAAAHEPIAAALYLLWAPMAGHFVLHVSWGKGAER